MKSTLLLAVLFTVSLSFSQVGINTETPEALLDITVLQPNNPTNTDGLLIPRINTFPSSDPEMEQNGMLVFLTTTSGSNNPGFYFWDQPNTSWTSITAADQNFDWFEEGTTNSPNAITDNIYTSGNVGIGDSTPDGDLDISNTGDAIFILEADSDNANEGDNPSFRLLQDGGALGATIEMEGTSNTAFPGSNANDFIMHTNNIGVEMQFAPNRNLALTLRSSGQVRLSDYTTATSHTGTATSMLALDAEGDIIQLPLPISNSWSIVGNAGTVSGTNFIGTTDAQDFDVRTNNTIFNRYTTTGQLEFLNTGGSIRLGENSGNTDDLVNRRNILIGDAIAPNISTGSTLGYDSAYNVGIGYQNLTSLTTGASNIAIGRNTMNSITTESDNVALGRQALEDLSGGRNVAIGAYSGLQRTSGDLNTFLGYNSNGFGASTGGSNTGIGSGALSRLTTGSNNTSLGLNSGSRITTGSFNTVIGKNAGMTSSGSSGAVSGTVIIGNNAGENNTLNNLFMIHNRNTSGVSPKSLLSGIFANTTFNSLDDGPYNDNRLGVNIDLGANAINLTHTLTVGGSAKIEELLNLNPGVEPSAPSVGDVYFDATLDKLRVYTNGTGWVNLH